MSCYNSCDLCGDYTFKSKNDYHKYSYYHKNNELNSFIEQRKNKSNLELQEQIDLEYSITKIEEDIEDMKCDGYQCSNCKTPLKNENDIIEHEKRC